jgi:hypothetical protein
VPWLETAGALFAVILGLAAHGGRLLVRDIHPYIGGMAAHRRAAMIVVHKRI